MVDDRVDVVAQAVAHQDVERRHDDGARPQHGRADREEARQQDEQENHQHDRREDDAQHLQNPAAGQLGVEFGLAHAVEIDEDKRRDGQQVEDVHADRQPHQVGDQHDPAQAVGLVGLLLPFEHEPHDQRREHRRQGVDLAFDGREPERVGEGVGQRAHRARPEDGPCAGGGQFGAVARHEAPRQMGDGPEEEEDAEGAGQRVHGVHGRAHVIRIAEREERGQAGQHHEERRSGRVAHFEFVGGGDELRAVPEARHGFHRQQVDGRRYGEDRPADEVVPAFEKFHMRRFRVFLCKSNHLTAICNRYYLRTAQNAGCPLRSGRRRSRDRQRRGPYRPSFGPPRGNVRGAAGRKRRECDVCGRPFFRVFGRAGAPRVRQNRTALVSAPDFSYICPTKTYNSDGYQTHHLQYADPPQGGV